MVGGHVFERVRLVEDYDLVVRQQPAAGPPQRQVGEEQGVVHDQHVRAEHLLAGRVVEAIPVARALAAQAVPAVALHQVPHALERLERQVALAPVPRLPGPAADLHELVDRARRVEQRVRLHLRRVEAAEAEVVAAALHQHRAEVERQRLLEERQVLADELFLEADGVRRDDDLQILLRRRHDGRDEVREALADAGAGLDEQFLLVFDGSGDRLGHVELLRARLEAGVVLGYQPAGTDDGRDRHRVIVPARAVARKARLRVNRRVTEGAERRPFLAG